MTTTDQIAKVGLVPKLLKNIFLELSVRLLIGLAPGRTVAIGWPIALARMLSVS